MTWTATDCARQYLGMREVPGHKSNPAILAMLQLDADWPTDDATPWCSGFANWVAWNMGLPRSKSLRARSWLRVGDPVPFDPRADVYPRTDGNCVVVFSRGSYRPGPDVINAPGHVAFFDAWTVDGVRVVGGNQGDEVTERVYPLNSILGIRRLAPEEQREHDVLIDGQRYVRA